MKYLVGASIGGLFGFSVPLMMDVNHPMMIENDKSPRIEDPQPVEDIIPTPIDGTLILPDNVCGYISYESNNVKEQAKECLKQSLLALPAI